MDAIMIYTGLAFMIFLAIYSGYKRKFDLQKMGIWYFLLLLVISIATNLLLLKNTLFHSRFVPWNLKDGLYGLMGGASFGAILLNLMISAFLLGFLFRYLIKKNTASKSIHENDAVSTKVQFPEWFNKLSHSLSGCIVGSAFGIALLNILKDEPLEDLGGLAIGSIIGAAVLYSCAGLIVVASKIKNRT